jgi:hypothetical protein
MRVTLVGCRGGRASVSWPGILLGTTLVASLAAAGVVAFGLAVDWYSPAAFVLAIAMSVGVVIGGGVRKGLRTPPELLPPLGRAHAEPSAADVTMNVKGRLTDDAR